MTVVDWLITDEGKCEARPSTRGWDLIRDNYYFHRFLTDIVDLIEAVNNEREEWDYLPQIRKQVRQLITNSYWLQTQYQEPNQKTGVAVLTLYDEIGYPLTVQNVCAMPNFISPIHNHGTWGVVALLRGREKHSCWRRVSDRDFPNKIELVEEKTLRAGEIISFTPDAIHQVETLGEEPSFSFAIYGDTQPKSRFSFDPITYMAKSF
jgi:predicted metal-dependent enzyme (double-stranded beta helix superfamily)